MARLTRPPDVLARAPKSPMTIPPIKARKAICRVIQAPARRYGRYARTCPYWNVYFTKRNGGSRAETRARRRSRTPRLGPAWCLEPVAPLHLVQHRPSEPLQPGLIDAAVPVEIIDGDVEPVAQGVVALRHPEGAVVHIPGVSRLDDTPLDVLVLIHVLADEVDHVEHRVAPAVGQRLDHVGV